MSPVALVSLLTRPAFQRNGVRPFNAAVSHAKADTPIWQWTASEGLDALLPKVVLGVAAVSWCYGMAGAQRVSELQVGTPIMDANCGGRGIGDLLHLNRG